MESMAIAADDDVSDDTINIETIISQFNDQFYKDEP